MTPRGHGSNLHNIFVATSGINIQSVSSYISKNRKPVFSIPTGHGCHSLSAISDALSFGRHAANDDDKDLRHDGLEKSSAQTFISRAVPPDQKVQGGATNGGGGSWKTPDSIY